MSGRFAVLVAVSVLATMTAGCKKKAQENGGNSPAATTVTTESPKTVDTHRTRLMAKLDIHDTPGLVRYAIRKGLVRADS